MKKQLFIGHLLTLLCGGFIYAVFRSRISVLFRLFDFLSIDKYIENLRASASREKAILPGWFLFSLPDGLWIFSYMSLILLIWGNRITRHNMIWIFSVPTIIILLEVGQGFKLVKGTFDIADLFFYLLGIITPLLLYTQNGSKLKKTI